MQAENFQEQHAWDLPWIFFKIHFLKYIEIAMKLWVLGVHLVSKPKNNSTSMHY